jgi:hypothetical protein
MVPRRGSRPLRSAAVLAELGHFERSTAATVGICRGFRPRGNDSRGTWSPDLWSYVIFASRRGPPASIQALKPPLRCATFGDPHGLCGISSQGGTPAACAVKDDPFPGRQHRVVIGGRGVQGEFEHAPIHMHRARYLAVPLQFRGVSQIKEYRAGIMHESQCLLHGDSLNPRVRVFDQLFNGFRLDPPVF